MTEIRCVKCRRLLMKYSEWWGSVEIKCPKCGHMQDLTVMGGMQMSQQDYKFMPGVEIVE